VVVLTPAIVQIIIITQKRRICFYLSLPFALYALPITVATVAVNAIIDKRQTPHYTHLDETNEAIREK
jgi:hypothetical protein